MKRILTWTSMALLALSLSAPAQMRGRGGCARQGQNCCQRQCPNNCPNDCPNANCPRRQQQQQQQAPPAQAPKK
jgi:hypothetical protein